MLLRKLKKHRSHHQHQQQQQRKATDVRPIFGNSKYDTRDDNLIASQDVYVFLF